MEIAAWLRSLGLGQYAERFEARHIDEQRLMELGASDLKALGVELLSHRRRLLAAIRQLRSGAKPPPRLPPDELPP